MKDIRKEELKFKLADFESDINSLINLCNKDSLEVPNWITSRIKCLKLDDIYLKNEVLNEI